MNPSLKALALGSEDPVILDKLSEPISRFVKWVQMER